MPTPIDETNQRIRNRIRGPLRKEPAELVHLAALLARLDKTQTAFAAARDALAFVRIGKALARLSVADCNRGLTDREQRRRERLAADATALAKSYRLAAHCYGDPRGYVLKLSGRDLPTGFGGDGFGVA